MKIIADCDLAKLSYIGIGPVIDRLFVAENENDILEISGGSESEVKVIGNLSNILFAASYYECTFMKLSGDFNRVSVTDEKSATVEIGAGCLMNNAITELSDAGIGGLEELFGIPGTAGGMLFMNAGANGASISDRLLSVTLLKRGEVKKSNINFKYRETDIDDTILSAKFNLVKRSRKEIKENIDRYYRQRQSTQPIDKKSLGCVFKNPGPENPAWQLISRNGFSGRCEDGICVSSKHANFIINEDRGGAHDFIKLSQEIVRNIYMKEKIKLEYEIEILI